MATYNTRNLRDGVITLYDKAQANNCVVALDEGDLAWSQTQNVIEVLDRGVLDHIRKGDESAMDLSFTLKYQNLQADGVTPYEAITQTSGASGWTSTRAEDVYCISLSFAVLNTSDVTEETVSFRDVYYTDISFAEGDEFSTLAITGRSFRTSPTIT